MWDEISVKRCHEIFKARFLKCSAVAYNKWHNTPITRQKISRIIDLYFLAVLLRFSSFETVFSVVYYLTAYLRTRDILPRCREIVNGSFSENFMIMIVYITDTIPWNGTDYDNY